MTMGMTSFCVKIAILGNFNELKIWATGGQLICISTVSILAIRKFAREYIWGEGKRL